MADLRAAPRSVPRPAFRQSATGRGCSWSERSAVRVRATRLRLRNSPRQKPPVMGREILFRGEVGIDRAILRLHAAGDQGLGLGADQGRLGSQAELRDE